MGFSHNESWHLHTTCMVVIIHNIICNLQEILLWLHRYVIQLSSLFNAIIVHEIKQPAANFMHVVRAKL